MRRMKPLVSLVALLMLLCPVAMAQEAAEGEKTKPRRREKKAKAALTPEQIAERAEKMKAKLQKDVTRLDETLTSLQVRHDALSAMTAQTTLTVGPPSPRVFDVGSSEVKGRGRRGSTLASKGLSRRARRGKKQSDVAAPESPATVEVANTEEIKKALKAAVDAHFALLPLLDEQRKGLVAQVAGMEAGGDVGATGKGKKSRELGPPELRQKIQDAQLTVAKAEEDLQLLLAKAWLDSASTKLTTEDAKTGASLAQAAFADYLKLRTELATLEQQMSEKASVLGDGIEKALAELAPPRQKKERKPKDRAAKPRGEKRKKKGKKDQATPAEGGE